MENIKISFKGSSILDISKTEKKLCNFYSFKLMGRQKKSVNHHILLVDVSGSMYSEIDELREKIKLTLEALCEDKNNYVSIISYSGHNESYRIINGVKCDRISYTMSNVYETLDKELYSRGITVISEPLKEALLTTKRLAKVCNKHHIALFTDGCLVPLKWTSLEEENKCYEIAKECKEEDIYLNGIGFGKYYDSNFLKNLISIPSNGQLIHIDEIKDYYHTILDMVKMVNLDQKTNIEIKNKDYVIINSSTRVKNINSKLDLIKGEENIIVTIEDELNIDKEIMTKKKTTIDTNLIDDLMYSLTLSHLNNDDYESAEITLSQTQDIYLFNALSNCYSFTEKGRIKTLLSKAVRNKEFRYKSGREVIKITPIEDEPLCLLEVLRDIISDEKSKLLWDFKYPYKRIGMKKSLAENRYNFIHDKNGYGEVIDINIGSKKLNIGLRVEIKGEVIDSLSKLKLDSKIYREYNLIVNGNINTTELSSILSRKIKMKLKKEGIIKKTIKYCDKSICILDLTKLKTTNKRILQLLSEKDIASYIYDVDLLSCKVWALNKHIKELFINNSCNSLGLSSLSEEEIQARDRFRVSETGVFNELILSETENTDPFEIYPATVLEWKVERFPKVKIQAKEYVEYERFITEDLKETYMNFINELIKMKKKKNEKLLLINLIRISSALIRRPVIAWDNEYEKSKREFNKGLNMNMVVDERVTISTKTINDLSIRQDSYTVLTKCN